MSDVDEQQTEVLYHCYFIPFCQSTTTNKPSIITVFDTHTMYTLVIYFASD